MTAKATLAALLAACLASGLAACDQPGESADTPAASGGESIVASAGAGKPASAEVCPGCGKPESECTCAHDHAEHDHAHEVAPPPSEVTLTDGSKVPVIAVAALNADPKAYKGTFAIDGTVGEVFADKGKFMLIDCGVACGDASCAGCAADQQLPVAYDYANLRGELPARATRVQVVAEITPSETGGYALAVKEVHTDGKAVCSMATNQA